MNRQIEDIIYDEVLGEKGETVELVQTMKSYIELQREYMQTLEYDDIFGSNIEIQ